MSFKVVTRKAGDSALTIGANRASLAACDADIAAALSATPNNVFVAVLDDLGVTLTARYIVIRDWPPGVALGSP